MMQFISELTGSESKEIKLKLWTKLSMDCPKRHYRALLSFGPVRIGPDLNRPMWVWFRRNKTYTTCFQNWLWERMLSSKMRNFKEQIPCYLCTVGTYCLKTHLTVVHGRHSKNKITCQRCGKKNIERWMNTSGIWSGAIPRSWLSNDKWQFWG